MGHHLRVSAPPPSVPVPPGSGSLAEDAAELQHPALVRLQTGAPVGSSVKRAAKWALANRMAGQLLQFLGTIVTARLLLPEDYGKAAVIFPVTTFAAIFTSLGLGSAVAYSRRVTEELLSTAFWLNAVAGVVMGGVVVALAVPLSALFREPELVPLLALSSLTFVLNLSVVHLGLMERVLRFKKIAVIEITCTVLNIATIIATAAAGAGAYALVLGPIVSTVSTTLFMWVAVRWLPRRRPDLASLRELFRYTRGVTGFSMLNFWSRNADNLLLARFVSQTELGLYSRSYNVMRLPVTQMNTMMGRVLFPAMTRLRDDRKRLGRAWLTALSTAATLTAPVTLGMAVAAPAMVEVLYGTRWLGMVPVLQILAVSALPQILTTTVASLLRATGATGLLFRVGVATASMSLVAICIGLPWGTVGVATALLVKFYLEVLVTFRFALRQTGLRARDILGALWGVAVACLALAGVGVLVRLNLEAAAWQVLLAQMAACGATYLAVLALLDRRPLAQAWGILGRSSGSSGTREETPDAARQDAPTAGTVG